MEQCCCDIEGHPRTKRPKAMVPNARPYNDFLSMNNHFLCYAPLGHPV